MKKETNKLSELNRQKQDLLNKLAAYAGENVRGAAGSSKPSIMQYISKDTKITHSLFLDPIKVILSITFFNSVF